MRMPVLICGMLVLSAWPLSAGDSLVLKVSPAVSFAPANLTVKATVEADARNRTITVIAESDEFYRASEIQLDGDQAPRTSTFEFRSLPSGNYRVTATVRDARDKPLSHVQAVVNVLANGAGGR